MGGESQNRDPAGLSFLPAQPFLQMVIYCAPRGGSEGMSTVGNRAFQKRKLDPTLAIYRVVCGPNTCGSQVTLCPGLLSASPKLKWKTER